MWEAVCLMAIAAHGHAARPPERFDWRQRFDHYLYRTYRPQRTALLAGETLFEHATSGTSEHGPGPAGFGCRYGRAFASRVVRNTVEFAAAGLLKEDYRYRPSGKRGLAARLRYALFQSALTQGEHRRFAVSRAIAGASGIAASAAWRGRRLTGGYFASELGLSYLDHAGNILLTEFESDLKAFGRRVQAFLLRPELRSLAHKAYDRRLGD